MKQKVARMCDGCRDCILISMIDADRVRHDSDCMKCRRALLPLAFLLLCGCTTLPENATCSFEKCVPIDNTRLIVRQNIDFLPSLTGFRFPAGTYIPVAKDENGTYYRSPRGLFGLGLAVGGSYPVGGLYNGHTRDGLPLLKVWAYALPSRQVYDTSFGSFSENVEIVTVPDDRP